MLSSVFICATVRYVIHWNYITFENYLLGGKTWHRICLEIPCQPSDLFEKIIDIIPRSLPDNLKQAPNDFSRQRKLPLHRLITFILASTANGKGVAVEHKIGHFFTNARRAGLWPNATPASRAAVTKARKKLPWLIFQQLMTKVVALAYEIWPKHDRFLWHGLNIIAIDGSKYSLPATEELRATFQPNSGLKNGKGHYPQALVSTAYDVCRCIAVARTVAPANGSERAEALKLLPLLPRFSVVVFDRGYPSYEMFLAMAHEPDLEFLCRCPTSSTFPAVMKFMRSKQTDAVLQIEPSYEYRRHHGQSAGEPILVRAVKAKTSDGKTIILLTSLIDSAAYPADEIIALYHYRWAVEDYYRNEKTHLKIETFHARTPNGIMQELLAAVIMAVIAGILRLTAMGQEIDCPDWPQVKHSILSLATEAAFLVSDRTVNAWKVFKELLAKIKKVRYYQPKQKRPARPRVSKQPKNRWIMDRAQKMRA